MLNVPATDWKALYECDDPVRARMVATCVAAMEYEVRIEDPSERCVVEVSADDWPALVEVLDEIIAEQEQFDDFIDRWQGNASRAERRLLVAMIVIVSSLAIVGAIEL